MNKQTLNQCRQDVTRLENAADRLRELESAYAVTRDDLEIAKSALKIIATWANYPKPYPKSSDDTRRDFALINTRAMDALSLISEENQ